MGPLIKISISFYRIHKLLKIAIDLEEAEGIRSLTTNPSRDFSTALKQCSDIKKAGSKFDDLKNEVIRLDHLNRRTEGKVKGIDNVMVAFMKVSQAGKR